MKKYLLSCLWLISTAAYAQTSKKAIESAKPKLVVGIVVDQMRWDYLYRYNERYSSGGFKRLLGEGYVLQNTFISHLPSLTAVGHSTIYTGSVPAIHGIAGNSWMERITGKKVYCVSDSTAASVGISNSAAGQMSPRNLLATTVTDELKLASNFRSKVVGVSLKDRAAILPAGHTANAAFWMDDKTGHFITSSYYMQQLPPWVRNFNAKDRPEKLAAEGWNTLYPVDTYKMSTQDHASWEGLFPEEKRSVFPHDLKGFKTDKGLIRSTPFGNVLTLEFAKAAIEGYELGGGNETDFLAVNLASTDYVGHKFGPNSIEVEDTYLRLDKELAVFFEYLDRKIGSGNYLLFLTADHGAAHSADFLKSHNIPAGILSNSRIKKSLNKLLAATFKVNDLVISVSNYSVFFHPKKINQVKISEVKAAVIEYLDKQPGVQFAVDADNIGGSTIPDPLKSMIANGYNRKRTGQVIIVPEAGWYAGSSTGTTHGVWNPYDTHIPLIFMGWGIKPGSSNKIYHMTDIAPTVAAMLHIQMPNGAVGKPIEELMK